MIQTWQIFFGIEIRKNYLNYVITNAIPVMLKKIKGIPSGPGAFKGAIYFKATSTSALVNSLISSAFMVSSTHLFVCCTTSSISLGFEEVNNS